MSHSTSRQHHEQARKKHKQEKLHAAREAAKRPPNPMAKWFLIGGIALMLAFVIGSVFFL